MFAVYHSRFLRFDHFAILCELIPVGIPSLAINLQTLISGGYGDRVLHHTSTLLNCSTTLDIDAPINPYYPVFECGFAGADAFETVHRLYFALQQIQEEVYASSSYRGWLSPLATQYNYSQAWYLDSMIPVIEMHLNILVLLRKRLEESLVPLYRNETVLEFLATNYEPHMNKLTEAFDQATRLVQLESFPRQPLSFDVPITRQFTRRRVPSNNDTGLE